MQAHMYALKSWTIKKVDERFYIATTAQSRKRVPIQPLLLEGSSLYSMFKDFDPQDFHWVLPVYQYKEPEQLLATLAENVIAPAEGKAKALEERRRMFEAELTMPQ